jgi:hypothetical protein
MFRRWSGNISVFVTIFRLQIKSTVHHFNSKFFILIDISVMMLFFPCCHSYMKLYWTIYHYSLCYTKPSVGLTLFYCITRQRNSLRYYATRRKFADWNPDVIGFFGLPNPSSLTMVLGSTQPLTEMRSRNLPEGWGRVVGT